MKQDGAVGSRQSAVEEESWTPIAGVQLGDRQITLWMLAGKDRWLGGGDLAARLMAIAGAPTGTYQMRTGTSWPVFATICPVGMKIDDLPDRGWLAVDGTVIGHGEQSVAP